LLLWGNSSRGTGGTPIAFVGVARRHAAARKGLAALMMALVLRAAPASSGERPELVLPLVTTIALVSAARATPSQVGALGGGRPLLSLLPAQLILEDGYEYDPEDYLPARRSARLLDRDRIVSYELLRRPQRGWMARIAYDEEGRGPLTTRGERLSVFAEFRF
jgi:hypothetical protein